METRASGLLPVLDDFTSTEHITVGLIGSMREMAKSTGEFFKGLKWPEACRLCNAHEA